MTCGKKFVVWTWFHEDGTPAYIGWGGYKTTSHEAHPAKRVWAMRAIIESDLHIWLRRFATEPRRENHTTEVRFYRAEAQAIASEKRKIAKREGFKLLSNRPHGTKEGGGAGRQILDPNFEVYPSVRAAANHHGVNACTITRWCKTPNSGWNYLT